ncbi:WD40/YVTN/BNR-like repeat-containing protein [Marinobacter xestospongiae]|uniref:WD40/YVTN/BNR-like repeat-containing protein n=1 Tax=Marinobacter xestospongiae TaxID=994319 RepID=UPI0020058117|nr:YCF48-related protein [Marinobacter xestospongiae]MCK7566951.1 YCF48-related protein [Marinobacter xestospongiae]
MATRVTCKALGAACFGLSMALSAPAAFALADVIETPARETSLAPSQLLTDAATAGDRIIAVGERGHIIVSDDEGANWSQGQVPVSVTLTGVDFPTANEGWVVGHSGVVLHSDDRGDTWSVQLTGIGAAKLAIEGKEARAEALEARIAEAPEEEKGDLEWALDDLLFSLDNLRADLDIGPVNPLLDVWFENDQHGFVVGAYGMILRTRDGGETWQDWSGQLENPTGFHLNAITRITGGALVIVGEAGQIHVSVDNGETWELRTSPYEGSLFGVISTGQVNEILAFGLRGNILLSTDLGKSWKFVPNDAKATLNDGAVAEDGRITLVGNGGAVLVSGNGAESFREHFRSERAGVMSVVPVSDTDILIVGEDGVHRTDARGRDL